MRGLEITEVEAKVIEAVERVSDSIVSISSKRLERRFPFGIVPSEGQGSGVIIDAKGLIITNNHVIDQANKVQVTLKDGRTFVGEVVGSDDATDIAVVKVDATDLPAADLGDSETLRVGQFALAIGNALGLPGGPSVSLGVISAMGRPLPGADFIFEGFLQTDAAVNPGNSGGPLADLNGRVVGINTAMIPYAQGVGFAIPINTVKRIATEILEKGEVTRPWIGISGIELTPAVSRQYGIHTASGFLVAELVQGSPAEVAGLRPGDVIIEAGGHEVKGTKDLLMAISNQAAGEQVPFIIQRIESRLKVLVRLAEAPRQISYGRR